MLTEFKQKTLSLIHKIIVTITRKSQSALGFASLGVVAIVVDGNKKILLVKHTYKPGWYLPGGGVKQGEHPEEAISRELAEEAGVIVQAKPQLLSIFTHTIIDANDYPILYLVTRFTMQSADSVEIAEIAWFDYDKLPIDITPATKKRITEYFLQQPSPLQWRDEIQQ